ncbi:hypothetical protein GCM10009616_08190 [Microlunatus lacustris]
MTWTKLGSEFFDDCAEAGLSDAAVRTHAEAIGYLFGQENFDLTLKKSTMRRWSGSAQPEQAAAELVAAKFWQDEPGTWIVLHHADVIRQSLTAQMKKREDDKLSKRRKRSAVGTDVATEGNTDSATDVLATQTDRQTDIQAAVSKPVENINEETGGVEDWPPVAAVLKAPPTCGDPACQIRLVGIELSWGYCRDHREERKSA